MSDVIVLRGCLQQKGHIAGCKRGKDCGKKSIVINLSHYHHLKGENGSCHRCSEQSGKRSSHAHHDHGALALLGDMEKLTDVLTNGSPKLQGGSLPAHRSSHKVGENGGDKDQRRHPKGDGCIGVDGSKNKICSLIPLISADLIQPS